MTVLTATVVSLMRGTIPPEPAVNENESNEKLTMSNAPMSMTATAHSPPTDQNRCIWADNNIDRLLGNEVSNLRKYTELQGIRNLLENLNKLEIEEILGQDDKSMLIRHFRAQKGDIQRTLVSLRETLQWRKDFDVADIVKGENSNIVSCLDEECSQKMLYIRGYTKEGRAIIISHPCAPQTGNEPNQLQHVVYVLEKAVACTRRKSREIFLRRPEAITSERSTDVGNGTAKPCKSNQQQKEKGSQELEKFVLVCDYDGFRLHHSGPISTSQKTIEIFQRYYPERLHKAYMINPPVMFRAFWALIRPFIDPITREKIVFASGAAQIQKLFVDTVDQPHKLEKGIRGEVTAEMVKAYDSVQYRALPFDVAFDE